MNTYTSCECGRALGSAEEMLDDLGCAACGRQCCWACAIMIMTVAYCRPCANGLFEAMLAA